MSTQSVIDTVRPAADLVVVRDSTLAAEHDQLLREVHRRAASALSAAAAGVWPRAELRSLTTFLHAEVLRQASDEEVTLYLNGAAAPFAELQAQHQTLYSLTDQLEQLDTDERRVLPELTRLVVEILTLLERHLVAERTLLSDLQVTPSEVPSTADLLAGIQHWLPDNRQPVLILLDTLEPRRAIQLCIERLLRLHPGQAAEIHSSRESDLQRVCQWMHDFHSGRYGVTRLATGVSPAPLQVTRRQR